MYLKRVCVRKQVNNTRSYNIVFKMNKYESNCIVDYMFLSNDESFIK